MPEHVHNTASDVSPLEPYRRRWLHLKELAEDVRAHWREIDRWEFPRRGWWLAGDGDRPRDGAKYGERLLNNTITNARRGVSGLLWTGLTSESRNWFALSIGDDRRAAPDAGRYDGGYYDLYGETAPVRGWLAMLADTVRRVLADSNFYSEIFGVYDDAAAFGTAALLLEDDQKTVLNAVRLPVGSFWAAANRAGRVDTLYRRFTMTALQVAERWGLDHAPAAVRQALEQGRPDERTVVLQAIQPLVQSAERRAQSDSGPAPVSESGGSLCALRSALCTSAPPWARWESVYFPDEKVDGDKAPLGREWYRRQPFVVFRWFLDGTSAYGARCPGMDCLGEVKELQALERVKRQVLEHFAKPPMLADARMKGQLDNNAGGVSWVQGMDTGRVYTAPVYPDRFSASPQALSAILADIARLEERIENAHYSTLMFSVLFQNKQMTAAEVAARQEEKTVLSGPLVQRFENDLLAPVLDRAIDAILWNRLMPPPPEELAGAELAYEYSGPLAMTAKMMGLSNLERAMQMVVSLAQAQPDILDKVDFDQFVDVLADGMKVDPSVIREDAKVGEMRRAKAEMAQGQMEMRAQAQQARTARDLAAAKMGEGNALDLAVNG